MGRIDTQAIKQNTDLVELARRYTELRPIAAHEYAGACPKCGGRDRFHVRPIGWFCRQCHSLEEHGWSDAIKLVQWAEGVDFKEACARLSSGAVAMTPAPKAQSVQKAQKRPRRGPGWAREANELTASAHHRLWSPEGEPGRKYLQERGLQEHTWRTFGMGYLAETPTTERAPAIVLPWYRGGQVDAVRFRFLKPPADVKIKSLTGSRFRTMYGGHALPMYADEVSGVAHMRTLILVEGELNAASIWQVAKDSRVDVLSLGSESAKLPDAMVRLAEKYGIVLTWFDKPKIADRVAEVLPGAVPISDYAGDDKRDANDMLQDGHLGGFLAATRARACENDTDRLRALYFDLWDAAHVWGGVDEGTAVVMRTLAHTEAA